MSSLPQGVVVLLVVAVLAACTSHWRIRNFWLASAVSGLATCAVFYAVCFIQEGGPPEPAITKAFALFTGFGFLVALLIGFAVRVVRPALSRRA
ncbi:hypothetical protein [Thermomonas fusca]|jgi:hypothetical protein